MVNEEVAVKKYCSFGDAVVEDTGRYFGSFGFIFFDNFPHQKRLLLVGIWLHSSGALGASPDGLIRIPAGYGFCLQNGKHIN